MTTWFVTRHPGAVLWARDTGVLVADGGIVRDLAIERVEAGDVVVGTLPINLAAEVIAKGARYIHLSLEVPPSARGQELTPAQMRAFGAKLEEYDVTSLGQLHGGAKDVAVVKPAQEVTICIASGQPMANCLPLFMRMSAAIWIVQTDDPRAARTAERLKSFADAHSVEAKIHKNAPSSPLAAVEACADEIIREIRSTHPDARLVLNATGGTKLMSVGFANRVGPFGEVIYCDTENDRIEYFAPEGRPAVPMPNELTNIPRLMLVQGIEVVRAASDDAEWVRMARSRLALSEALAAFPEEGGFKVINAIAARAMPKYKNGRVDRPFQPQQVLNRPARGRLAGLFERIAKAGVWAWDGNLSVTFSSESAARYVMGGWLEELAAAQLASLSERAGIPPGHWAAGVEVRPVGAISDQDKPFNELDLIVVWRNRLLVVECKTGTQAADSNDSMNITNKLEAIRQYLGGPFASVWLASAQSLPARSVARERCRQFGVDVVHAKSLGSIGQFVAGWMGLDQSLGARTDWVEGVKTRSTGVSQPAGAMAKALSRAGVA